jgi:hypothetical protein
LVSSSTLPSMSFAQKRIRCLRSRHLHTCHVSAMLAHRRSANAITQSFGRHRVPTKINGHL